MKKAVKEWKRPAGVAAAAAVAAAVLVGLTLLFTRFCPGKDTEKERPKLTFLGIQRTPGSSVNTPSLLPEPGLQLAAAYINAGARTAFDVGLWSRTLVAPYCKPLHSSNPCTPKLQKEPTAIEIVGPRTVDEPGVLEWMTLSVGDYPKEYEDGIRDGKMTIFLYGYLVYRDEWQKPHWTAFCEQWVPKGGVPEGAGWVYCEGHNDRDR